MFPANGLTDICFSVFSNKSLVALLLTVLFSLLPPAQLVKVTGIKDKGQTSSIVVRGSNQLVRLWDLVNSASPMK
jgi:hypothetical protein